jgi:hypothetical protein
MTPKMITVDAMGKIIGDFADACKVRKYIPRLGKFICMHDDDCYAACDNTFGNCAFDFFSTRKDAEDWLNGKTVKNFNGRLTHDPEEEKSNDPIRQDQI